MMLAGLGMFIVAIVGSGFALVYMMRLLAATAGAAPMPPFGEAVTALANIFAFLLALVVVRAMGSGDRSSGGRRSSGSRTHSIGRDDASDGLDRIEDSLDE
jgi:membrane protein implicated in regulation of membrane protease activity